MIVPDCIKGCGLIDGHLHIYAWDDPSLGTDFLHGFEECRKAIGEKAINIDAITSAYHDIGNNMLCAFYKLANASAFIHGGIGYAAPETTPKGMDPRTQYMELMDIGFDGIKLLECKPNYCRKTRMPICGDYCDTMFAQIERDRTHVLMHVADPDEFWDKNKAPTWAIEQGWFYGEGDYPTYAGIYEMTYKLLENHPDLNLTFAHFFFLSKRPEELERLFALYPNISIDLTPGSEMYYSFAARPDYYREFFTKYTDRVVFGTDGAFPDREEARQWLCVRVFQTIATDETFDAFWKDAKGLNVPRDAALKIFSGNFTRMVGEKPKDIDRKKLKAYLEKYRSWILDKPLGDKIDALASKML